ncbi:polyprenyl synthetase family protein [Thiorhodovibrio frisius]|nr:polyprenyl synthetase family protein [Thiorhodovibrio frisius]
MSRIEQTLKRAIAQGSGEAAPPLLEAATRHAVFPGGGRVRPRLCLAVALACGDDAPALSDAAAAALELLHCASLVHDDLPCFDDAATRRGRPSVHAAYGERLAVLVGDGLIVRAFELLAWNAGSHPARAASLTAIVGRAVGMTSGIIAGQAWECEPEVELTEYHRQKTAALFFAATEAGAAAAGQDPAPWHAFGEKLGLAYQVADDLRDVAVSEADMGKPMGQDQTHGRPSAVAELGLDGALGRLKKLVDAAVHGIPACPGRAKLAELVGSEMRRLLPAELVDRLDWPQPEPDMGNLEENAAMQITWSERLSDVWHQSLSRLIASPAFQRWAADFPLTRPVAQRRASGLFDICAGFVYSQILDACVRLELFERLAKEPVTPEELGAEVDLSSAAADRLLRAGVALRLFNRRAGGRFGLGPHGAAMLGNPGIAAIVRHHRMLYRDLTDPLALLRGELAETELGRYWAYAGAATPGAAGDAEVASYSQLMTASHAFVAGDTLDAYSFKDHQCLLDVGGGEGSFLLAAGQRWPHLKLQLFDLPAVAERAAVRLRDHGLGERSQTFGGDMKRDPLPRGADLISFVRVIHDHDDDMAMTMLKAARAALPMNGTLLVTEPMAETPGAEPIGDAYFGFYLLAMGSGRPRPPRELAAMLKAAGFSSVRLLKTRQPMQTRVMIAKPDHRD